MRYKIGGKRFLLCQRRKIRSSGKACVVVGVFWLGTDYRESKWDVAKGNYPQTWRSV